MLEHQRLKDNKHLRIILFISLLFIFTSFGVFHTKLNTSLAQQGCCSSHGGVRSDGCGCNDGSPLSAICAPNYTCTANTAPVYTTPAYTPAMVPVTAPIVAPTSTPTPKPTPTAQTTTKEILRKEIIPFTVSTQKNPDLYVGQKVVKIKGKNGEKTIIFKATYLGDREQKREKISENITQKPINGLDYVGTKPSTFIQSLAGLYLGISPFVLLLILFRFLYKRFIKKGENKDKTNWYKSWWGIIVAVVFLPYFAVWYLWKKTKYKKSLKILGTLIIIVLTIFLLSLFSLNRSSADPASLGQVNTSSDEILAIEEELPDNSASQVKAPEETPQEAEQTKQIETVVTNQATTVAQAMPSGCQAKGLLPDPNCTPGATDPRVTQDTIKQTICVVGYTKTVRPSTSITSKQKLAMMAKYGFTDSPSNYEFDHLIPLEGGGSSDLSNLWPEPIADARKKDTKENLIKKQICSGQKTLQQAQDEIRTNWALIK